MTDSVVIDGAVLNGLKMHTTKFSNPQERSTLADPCDEPVRDMASKAATKKGFVSRGLCPPQAAWCSPQTATGCEFEPALETGWNTRTGSALDTERAKGNVGWTIRRPCKRDWCSMGIAWRPTREMASRDSVHGGRESHYDSFIYESAPVICVHAPQGRLHHRPCED